MSVSSIVSKHNRTYFRLKSVRQDHLVFANRDGWEFDVYDPVFTGKGKDRGLASLTVCFTEPKHVVPCDSVNLVTGTGVLVKAQRESVVPQHVRKAADVILRRVMARPDYFSVVRSDSSGNYPPHDISFSDTEPVAETSYTGGLPQRWVKKYNAH